MLKCYECSFEAENAKGLSYHVRVRHNKAYPDYLVEHEMNGVWPTCSCGCEQKVRFLCGKFCARVKGHQCVNVPKSALHRQRLGDVQRGKPETPQSNVKRSVAMLDYHSKHDNVREAVRKAKTGVPMSSETRRKLGETRKAMFASGELTINREAISKRITQLYLEGGFQWCVGDYTSTKTGKIIAYRSSWELEYAKRLDADDNVAMWEYEPFAIVYEVDGESKRYLPDFLVTYVDGVKELVEVKPKELESTIVNQAKRLAALELCDKNDWCYAGWSL